MVPFQTKYHCTTNQTFNTGIDEQKNVTQVGTIETQSQREEPQQQAN